MSTSPKSRQKVQITLNLLFVHLYGSVQNLAIFNSNLDMELRTNLNRKTKGQGQQTSQRCHFSRIRSKSVIIESYDEIKSNDYVNNTKEQQSFFIMVKVKDFCGAVFHPEEYQAFLHNNIEHLQLVPMSKTFNTAEMLASGKLCPEVEPFCYIYRQNYLNHTSFGIMAEISLEDYHLNKIKKHEKTLHRPGMNHTTYLSEHVGPVVVSHREDQQLSRIILEFVGQNHPFSMWNTLDGREHALWKVKQSQVNLEQRFQKIQSLYILDGHHRLQAAHQNYMMNDKSKQQDLWIQAIIYSSDYVMVHPQHRIVQNIPQNLEIINQMLKMQHIQVEEITCENVKDLRINLELQKYEVILKLFGKMHGINFKKTSRGVLEKVTASRLQNQLFSGCLSEESLKKLKYMPGIMEEKFYEFDIVFFVRQPQIETVFQVADQSVTMPPKSTWIEPKPCSHMVIRMMG